MSHRRAIALGSAAWTPPQSANLVAAWVSGLSGAVATLGSWAGQYGTTYAATLAHDAQVTANGLELDGDGDYASAPIPQVLTSFTVTAWIYSLTDAAGLRFPLSHGEYVNVISWFYWPDTRAFLAYTGGGVVSFSPVPVGWTHIAVTRAPGGTVAYANGLQVATGTAPDYSTSGDPFLLGIHRNLSNYPWRGYLDCVYYWQGAALSADDIADLYANDPYRRGNI